MLRGLIMRALVLIAILSAAAWVRAEVDRVTRVYALKNVDVSIMSRALDIVVRDPSKTRITSGEGRRLVVSDTADQQDNIAKILPVLDQHVDQTDHDKILMQVLMNASKYIRDQKLNGRNVGTPTTAAATPARTAIDPNVPARSYDKVSSAKPYKSIYASDDAKFVHGPRYIMNEPVIPSLGGMKLKGIFKRSSDSPLALLDYGGVNYTARDGGLFENNRTRVKDIKSKVLKDRVVLEGPDRIPCEIKFASTL